MMSIKPFSSSAPRRQLEDVEREVKNLSAHEQQCIHQDLYGTISDDRRIVETDERRSDGLQALERHLEDAVSQGIDASCFRQALKECPDYVNDRDFRLMFLRAEQFDAEKAAKRLLMYWDKKVEIWGPARAFHRLSILDFEETDRIALERGGVRVLPARDKGGRAIIVIDKTRFDQRITHRRSMYRLIWYMHEVALEDISVQTNGIVYIAGCPRRRSTLMDQDRKLDSVMLKVVREALPVRAVGIHHYVSSFLLEYVVPVILALFGGDMRKRYKLHVGDEEKFLNELDEYGISVDVIPKDMGGKHPFEYEQWLEQRMQER